MILQGRDKDIATFQVKTGDKFYDSGGPGGSRIPDQPGNYLNCSDPFNESTNCTSLYTFCSQGDTVTINFKDYLIVTGDRIRIFSSTNNSGTPLYNSVNQGVSINGMRLTTGTSIKSKSPDGCLTVEWFCTTIGNSVGWEADFIVNQKGNPNNSSCLPTCKNNVIIQLPTDTCFVITSIDHFGTVPSVTCNYELQLFYPFNSNPLKDQAVDQSHIGQTFLYQIRDTTSSASCFGYLSVRSSDFFASYCINDTVTCIEWDINFAPILRSAGCNGASYKILNTTYEVLDCKDGFLGKVYRVIERKNTNGILDTCRDTIYIKKFDFDSLQCPSDLKLSCEKIPKLKSNVLTPDNLKSTFDLDDDNLMDGTTSSLFPSLNGIGFPDSSVTCRSTLSYSDLVIPGCGSTFKIRRQWTIKSQCLGIDSICIQNITVEDLLAPIVPDIQPLSYQIDSDDCKASIRLDSISNITDCNYIAQRVELSYPDPQDENKLIVINSGLPLQLSLPSGGYNLKFTFSDMCFNATRLEACLLVSDQSIPASDLRSDTTITVDPSTCWSRIQASDLQYAFTSSCCTDLFFAIALKDSVDYFINSLNAQLNSLCKTSDSATNNSKSYQPLIDHWLTAFVFKPYLDLSACSDQKILVRAFKACAIPGKDPAFPCDEHQWFCYNTIPEYRSWHNSFSTGNAWCNSNYVIGCWSDQKNQLNTQDQRFKYASSLLFNDTSSCSALFYRTTLNAAADVYQESEITIHVQDTSSTQDIGLPDIVYQGSVTDLLPCCLGNTCLGETFNPGLWPGAIGCNCDSSKFLKFYGGPVHNSAVYDVNGYYAYPTCSHYNVVDFPRPIYCSQSLLGDTSTINSRALDAFFYKPVFNKLAGNNEFAINIPCDSAIIRYRDSTTSILDCGQTIIARHWSFHTKCGKNISAKQKIQVRKQSGIEVIFPADQIFDCINAPSEDSSLAPSSLIQPILKGINIASYNVEYVDAMINVHVAGSCKTIQRTWTIRDTCVKGSINSSRPEFILNDTLVADPLFRYCVYRSLKDNGDGVISYRQWIRFVDTKPPTLILSDTIVRSQTNCIASPLRLAVSLKDDCTPIHALQIKTSLDLFSNGSEDVIINIDSNAYTIQDLPVGRHRLINIVYDLCSNSDTVISNIQVLDGGGPTPRCIAATIPILIPASGRVEILARDFDAGSLAGCSFGPVTFSFSPLLTDSFRIYSCDSLGIKPIRIWITNSRNLQNTCTVILQVNASNNACTASLDLKVEGKITTNQNNGIAGVDIRTNLFNTLPITNAAGQYTLNNLVKGQLIRITPDKVDDPLNGVSTIDLLLIEKHIKGLTIIKDPYVLIAGDVNKSGSITVTDIVELRKLILGTTSTFPNNKPWIFIPTSYKFQDPLNPWIYPAFLEYPTLNFSISDADFYGIKVGDVNNSVVLGAQDLESRQPNSIQCTIKEEYRNGDSFWDFYLPHGLSHVQAFQLNFKLPAGLTLDLSHFDQLNLKLSDAYSFFNNYFKIAWSKESGINLNAQYPLFSLKLSQNNSIKNQESVTPLASFIFTNNELKYIHKVEILKTWNSEIVAYPNPTSNLIVIKFYLQNLLQNKIFLTYGLGQQLRLMLPSLKPGWNHITLNKNDLQGPGQYFFIIQSDTYVQQATFIVL